jgi:hypothetical protein
VRPCKECPTAVILLRTIACTTHQLMRLLAVRCPVRGSNTDRTDVTTCLENYTEASYKENCNWKKRGIWNDTMIGAG